MPQQLKVNIQFQDFQQNIKKTIEIEDDCEIQDLIDNFVDLFQLDHQFHICKDKDGIQVLDIHKTVLMYNIKDQDILYCFKNPRGSNQVPINLDNQAPPLGQLRDNILGQQRNNQPPIGYIGNIKPFSAIDQYGTNQPSLGQFGNKNPLSFDQFGNIDTFDLLRNNQSPSDQIGQNGDIFGQSINKSLPLDQQVNQKDPFGKFTNNPPPFGQVGNNPQPNIKQGNIPINLGQLGNAGNLGLQVGQKVNFQEPLHIDKKLDQQAKLQSNEKNKRMNFDFYFNNILVTVTQIIIISKDESFVTLQTLDQLVKFVSFKHDAIKEIHDINVLQEDIDLYIKYRDTTVVCLKNKIGCIIYWNNDKVTERIIKINK